ncbi:unnamed protein product [Caenorhabditis auriculariae]|uniref:Glucosylceramidase n=1 Tax=Caenorhabditis auriculariae TaxID=2777116 RepID=A0A8S1HY19_9PELO|nr:unnamed protein product [Caenorhabditis auriculariae]
MRPVVLLFLVFPFLNADGCNKRFLSTGIVCVCNATYCDQIPPPNVVKGHAALYESSKSGKRLDRSVLTSVGTQPSGDVVITLDPSKKYQKMIGFGAAFTDATGANLKSLPNNMANRLIQQNFSPEGLGYTLGRVPIASCDFSTRVYSYDDVDGDFYLNNFALVREDFQWKIPYIKMAQQFSNYKLKLIASPWAAPGWMKTNGQMQDGGQLLGDFGGPYWQTWTHYLIRFLEEYGKNDISFWAMTPQNEPANGNIKGYPFQTMFLSPEMERDFVKSLLGPALRSSIYGKNVSIIIVDDNRNQIPTYANVILADIDAAVYVAGIGAHWYSDDYFGPELLTQVHNSFPDKFILGTESCPGWQSWAVKPLLGSWDRAEQITADIIGDMNNWSTGFMDWNMALDPAAGPNWANNSADGPIIVFANQTEYYKQPVWYAMGHFSKFALPNGYKIDVQASVKSSLQLTGFVNPDGSRVLVAFNNATDTAKTVVVKDTSNPNSYFQYSVGANTITTLYIQ